MAPAFHWRSSYPAVAKTVKYRVIGRSVTRLQLFFHHKSSVQTVTDIEPTIGDNGDDL